VEIDDQKVKIVYRIDPVPRAEGSKSGFWQHCRRGRAGGAHVCHEYGEHGTAHFLSPTNLSKYSFTRPSCASPAWRKRP
jgi:hypothetical protein